MRSVRKLVGILLLTTLTLGAADRASAEESLGNKVRRIFAPTPTPTPRKHRTSSSASKKTKSTPVPSPSPSQKKKRKASASPTPTPSESSTPAPSSSPSATAKEEEESSGASPSPSPSPSARKKGAPATIATKDISGYEENPPEVRQILNLALELTTRNLGYTYGSADPTNGGMDCSGFVFYVLSKSGLQEVPRDSSQQYVWVRKTGNFKAVNSRREDTFELDELVPGDLLFWTGTYKIERDPPITHAMFYLGREKGTNQRIMVGASDGRTYKGESRYGVSVFDFKMPKPSTTGEGKKTPSFIGYGHVPGL